MQIPLINEHLFSRYFVRLSVGNATTGFATYGFCHPYLFLDDPAQLACVGPEYEVQRLHGQQAKDDQV